MRKKIAALLMGILLAALSPAGAEYGRYQVTEGNWWVCFPLDAHNAVVSSWDWHEDGEPDPWFVCWYRDGEPYRELTGSFPEGDRTARMMVPYPARWDGEHLSLYYCIRTRELETSPQGNWIPSPDPACFDVHMAEWTAEGLENDRILPEAWFDTYDGTDRGILVYSGEKGRTALYNGNETVLPESIPVNLSENVLRVLPAGGDVCLVKVMNNTDSVSQVVCVDRGAERYRVTLPEDEFLPGRILLADGRGGFFCVDGYRYSDYRPEPLVHYRGEDGQADRTLYLAGDRVNVHSAVSVPGPENGGFTVYGTAVANSRKIYAVFAMTLDGDFNVRALDVRKIDPAYGDYGPVVLLASDGTPWVFVQSYGPEQLFPVLIPFSELKKSSNTYGIRLTPQ